MVKNPVKKTSLNFDPKMTSWGPFWDPQILPNWARSLTKSPPNRKKCYFWRAHCFQDFLSKCAASFHDFWVPPGTPKFAKKRVFPENWSPMTAIFSMFAVNAAVTIVFIRFSMMFEQRHAVCLLLFSVVFLVFDRFCFLLDGLIRPRPGSSRFGPRSGGFFKAYLHLIGAYLALTGGAPAPPRPPL